MKKFLAVFAIAGSLVACNDGGEGSTSTDTTGTTGTGTTIGTDTTGTFGTDTTGTFGTDTAGTGTGTTDTTQR